MPFGFPDKIDLDDVVWTSCNTGWTTIPAPEFVTANKTVVSTSEYKAIGGQISRTYEETRGPALEVNSQYFADDFSFCVRAFGYGCNTGGSCKYRGLNEIIQGTVETLYEYAEESGELVKQTAIRRNTLLSAAQPFDWRSSIEGGMPVDFKMEYGEEGFLSNRYTAEVTITEYYKEAGKNIELTTTLVSPASRGIGINQPGEINATGPDGIKSTTKRFSTTTSTRPGRPDSANSLTVETVEKEVLILLDVGNTYTGPEVSGPYVIERQIPVPMLYDTQDEVDAAVESYSQYLQKFIKGDLYGVQVAESLRSEICDGWKPGMPFRYADTQNNKISALRMDACTWGVTQDESIVVTNGVWTGFSDGSLAVGDNLVGNSTPELPPASPSPSPGPSPTPPSGGGGGQSGGTPTPPPSPSPPPQIENDRVVQNYQFSISIEANLSGYVTAPGNGQIPPDLSEEDRTYDIEECLIMFCEGSVVGTGDLLAVDRNGTMPSDEQAQLIIDGATIVVADVFASTD